MVPTNGPTTDNYPLPPDHSDSIIHKLKQTLSDIMLLLFFFMFLNVKF